MGPPGFGPLPPAAAVLPASAPGDFVGFTFSFATLALLAATIFFLAERAQVSVPWRTPLLVAALVTGVAFANYLSMRETWARTYDPATQDGSAPTEFRYLDWLLTVPMMCGQFYLVLNAAAGSRVLLDPLLLLRLVLAGVAMLVCGYVGEGWDHARSLWWGAAGTLGWLVILYELFLGQARRLANSHRDPRVRRAFDLLCGFALVGWSIYPVGYLTRPGNPLAGLEINFNVIYNVGDLCNKVGFGLVVWALARAWSVASEPVSGKAGPVG